jgi:predicted transcriptional regulator
MTDKQCVIDAMQSLPDSASIEDLRYEAETILDILEGQRDIDEGRTHSHEEVMAMARQCLSK